MLYFWQPQDGILFRGVWLACVIELKCVVASIFPPQRSHEWCVCVCVCV